MSSSTRSCWHQAQPSCHVSGSQALRHNQELGNRLSWSLPTTRTLGKQYGASAHAPNALHTFQNVSAAGTMMAMAVCTAGNMVIWNVWKRQRSALYFSNVLTSSVVRLWMHRVLDLPHISAMPWQILSVSSGPLFSALRICFKVYSFGFCQWQCEYVAAAAHTDMVESPISGRYRAIIASANLQVQLHVIAVHGRPPRPPS